MVGAYSDNTRVTKRRNGVVSPAYWWRAMAEPSHDRGHVSPRESGILSDTKLCLESKLTALTRRSSMTDCRLHCSEEDDPSRKTELLLFV